MDLENSENSRSESEESPAVDAPAAENPESGEETSLQDEADAAAARSEEEDRLRAVESRIEEVQKQISELARDRRATMSNAQAFQIGVQERKGAAGYAIEQQVQDVNSSILALQARIDQLRRTPTANPKARDAQILNVEMEIARQKTQREQLESRRRAVAQNAQVESSIAEQRLRQDTIDLNRTRENLERELADLRDEAASLRGGNPSVQE